MKSRKAQEATDADNQDLDDVLGMLRGLEVWHVNAGGVVGSSFSLSLGARVARSEPLRNPNATEEFRNNEGEMTLYVWSTWRLDNGGAVGSSDQDQQVAVAALRTLIGQTVLSAKASTQFHDLAIELSGAGRLAVFCDHVPPDPSYRYNWELVSADRSKEIAVGPGLDLDVRA